MEYSTTIKILLIFQVINLIVCQPPLDQEAINRDILKKNLQIIKERCDKNAAVSIPIERIAEHIQNISEAGKQIGQNIRQPSDIKNICKNRQLLLVPLHNFFNFMQQCLPKDEAYFKDYMTRTVDELFEFLCRNDGANIDRLSGQQFQQCVSVLSRTSNLKTEFENCANDLFDTFSNVTTKAKLCKQLDTLGNCLDGILKRHCYQYGDVQILNEEFFDAITKPCSSCTFTIQLFLLFFAIFLTKIFS